jgi:hypothetical protein
VDEDVQECEGLGGVGQWYLLVRYQIDRRPTALSIGRWLHLHMDASSMIRMLFYQ